MLFHDAQEQLEGKSGSWSEQPASVRGDWIAAANLALRRLAGGDTGAAPTLEYFAIPGEAQWGC